MSPFLKMHLKSSSTPIRKVATYFTFILNSESMKFVKPIGNWLSIPTKRQIFRIINWSLCLLLWFLLLLYIIHFLVSTSLFLSNQIHSIVNHIGKFFSQFWNSILFECYHFFSFLLFFDKFLLRLLLCLLLILFFIEYFFGVFMFFSQ